VKYNHAVSVSFSIESDNDADDITGEEIADRLVRILNHSDSLAELIETADIFDTIVEDENE
jgi:hypothetical protein